MKKLLGITALVLSLALLVASPAWAVIRQAGYTKYSGTVTSNAARITVPTITCNTGDSGKTVAAWVGIDDFSFLSQTGFSAFCSGTTESYSLWYEVYPRPARSTGIAVSPGDRVNFTINVRANDVEFIINNLTDGTGNRLFYEAEPGAHAGIRNYLAEDGIGGQVAPKFTEIVFRRNSGFVSGMTKVQDQPPFNVGAINSCGGTCQTFWVRDSR